MTTYNLLSNFIEEFGKNLHREKPSTVYDFRTLGRYSVQSAPLAPPLFLIFHSIQSLLIQERVLRNIFPRVSKINAISLFKFVQCRILISQTSTAEVLYTEPTFA